MDWTADKIAAMAANAAAEKRGRDTARPALWTNIMSDGLYLWGYCKGSGSMPYQTQINLALPAFTCTCPLFAKPPCKHALGLLFYWEQNKANIEKSDQYPEWVQKWKAKHQPAPAATAAAPLSPEAKAEQEKAKLQRRSKRLENMRAGMEELQLWLLDLAAQGAANADVLQAHYWDTIAKRMVDAQLPRIAIYLRETATALEQAQDWLAVLAQRLGELYLLVQAFQKLANQANSDENSNDEANRDENNNENNTTLAAAQSPIINDDDLLAAIGVHTQKKEVLAESQAIAGLWAVVGVEEDVDIENRDFRKVWLYQLDSPKPKKALILDFVFGANSYEQLFIWATVLQGQLSYYPSASPQRALLPTFQIVPDSPITPERLQPFSDIAVMLEAYTLEILANFTLIEQLVACQGLWLNIDSTSQKVMAIDAKGQQIELIFTSLLHAYRILAVSGGAPVCLIGKLLNSCQFQPLSLLCDAAIIPIADALLK
jgi:hypothetical protein